MNALAHALPHAQANAGRSTSVHAKRREEKGRDHKGREGKGNPSSAPHAFIVTPVTREEVDA